MLVGTTLVVAPIIAKLVGIGALKHKLVRGGGNWNAHRSSGMLLFWTC